MEMTKTKSVLFIIALFLTNVAIFADMVIVPAIADIYAAFPDNVNLVNFIVSGPALILIPTALIAPKLMQYFSKKNLIVVSSVIFCVVSIGGIAIENVVYMAITRAIVGAMGGIISICVLALLSEVYVDENKRSMMLGFYNAAMALIGAAMSAVAGIFAETAWQSVFEVYWISVPVLVILVLGLPQIAPVKETVSESGTKEKISVPKFAWLSLSFMAFCSVYMVVFYQIAVYVAENSIGGTAVSGMLASVGTIGSAVCCALFGFVYNKFKESTIAIGFVVLGVGYLVLAMVPSIAIIFITCTLMGACYGTGFSYYYMQATVIVPPSRIPMALGLIAAVGGFSGFISTYFVTFLKGIIGAEQLIGIMPVLIIICAIFAVLEFFNAFKCRKNRSIATNLVD